MTKMKRTKWQTMVHITQKLEWSLPLCILECQFCLFLRFFDLIFSFFRQVVFCFINFIRYFLSVTGPSWSWSYGSWIYNYPSNQCLSPLKLEFEPRSWRCVIDTTLCDTVCQLLAVVFCLYSTNKTDSNDITDILLKMALNTINETKQILACHNIIDITKISQLYYYLGYTIRNIMLKVSVHFNTQRLTCNSRRWLEHDKNQYALSQLMGFQPFPLYWISNVCTDINNQDRVAQTSLKYKSHLNLKCKSTSFSPPLNLIEVSIN
jgi:hypothetical protein